MSRQGSLLIAAFAMLVSLLFAGNALAHAELVRSEPAAGAMLSTPPTRIMLVFDEEIVEGTSANVVNAAGEQVDSKNGMLDLNDLDHKTFVLGIPTLPTGLYTVKYTATSRDGHSEDGSFTFTIRGAQAVATATSGVTATVATTTTRTPAPMPTPAPTATVSPPSGMPGTGEPSATPTAILAICAIVALVGGIMLRRVWR
jgi:methionine-rich copper-binding protein CopC